MKLSPQLPPGRSSRKALAFVDEITRLVAEGYSGEAIRQALADAGVIVSKSTMRREVARARSRARSRADHAKSKSSPAPAALPARSPAPRSPPTSAPPVSTSADSTTRTGKEIAEDFFRGRINNPLIRARSNP